MGVIKRQGIKHSIVTYLGVIIGAINTLFIYPNMQAADLGLIRFIIDTSIIIVPMVVLGLNQVSIRYFPDFKDESNGHNGFLFFLLAGVSIGMVLFSLIVFLFQDQIYAIYDNKGPVYQNNLGYIFPCVIFGAYSWVFTSYAVNQKRVAIPQLFNNLYFKIGQPILVVLYLMNYINMTHVMWGVAGIFAAQFLSNALYIKVLGQFNLKPKLSFLKNKAFLKEMAVYAAYGILGSIGTILATRIDTVMLGSLDFNQAAVLTNLPNIPLDKANLSSIGIYSIAIFLAGIIAIPTMAINAIVQPIIAQAWKDNNTAHIKELYIKSSLNLMVAGIFLIAVLWASIDDLYSVMANTEVYRLGKYAFLFVAISKIVDMATSINTPIIGFSKFFRFNFYAILFLAIFNIAANYLLIPSMQMKGAALATMASVILFNIVKFGFIWWKMKMQPFSWRILLIMAIGGLAYFIGTIVPPLGNMLASILPDFILSQEKLMILLNIGFRSLVIFSTYIVFILGFKVSPDINGLFFQIIKKIKNITL